MKKPGWDESLSAALNARAALPGLVRSYFERGRKLTGKPPSAAALHRFRLDTKALRYTLELFRTCYGPGLDRRLAVLRKIQAYLGAINDYATTTELVAARLPGDDTERARIQGILGARARRKTLEFRRYAQQLFNDVAEQRRWDAYLSRPRRGQCVPLWLASGPSPFRALFLVPKHDHGFLHDNAEIIPNVNYYGWKCSTKKAEPNDPAFRSTL